MQIGGDGDECRSSYFLMFILTVGKALMKIRSDQTILSRVVR